MGQEMMRIFETIKELMKFDWEHPVCVCNVVSEIEVVFPILWADVIRRGKDSRFIFDDRVNRTGNVSDCPFNVHQVVRHLVENYWTGAHLYNARTQEQVLIDSIEYSEKFTSVLFLCELSTDEELEKEKQLCLKS